MLARSLALPVSLDDLATASGLTLPASATVTFTCSPCEREEL